MDNTLGRRSDNESDRADSADGVTADDGNVDERTLELRGEIQKTRVELTETIDAIQERLQPGNIVAHATDRVKSAATEGVQDMAEIASHTAQQVSDYTRGAASGMTNVFRQHPLPLALIGVGAAWMLLRSRRPSSSEEWMRGQAYNRHEDVLAMNQEGMTRNRPDSASHLASQTRNYASKATQSMRRMARQRQHQLNHMVHENPLLVGIGALALGVAFGMAVPETETENEYLGDARDTVVDRARQMARDAANKVQNAASGVADAAGKLAANP